MPEVNLRDAMLVNHIQRVGINSYDIQCVDECARQATVAIIIIARPLTDSRRRVSQQAVIFNGMSTNVLEQRIGLPNIL